MRPSLTDVPGISVGCAEDLDALTGCTVVLTGPRGALCSVDVRGAAPGTRETDLLSPENMIGAVHAVVLSGGSAYGLDSAGGVMQWLEEQKIGYPVEDAVVPIVTSAVLCDLPVGSSEVRPDRAMGYLAASRAGLEVPEGCRGAGAGATVGKVQGYDHLTKSGQGTWSISAANGLVVGALVAVNSLGDVIDPRTGQVLAGTRDDSGSMVSSAEAYKRLAAPGPSLVAGANTTIAVVATNARLDKGMARRVAMMAHDGMARAINPVHTLYDGDAVFVLATGEIDADVTLTGQLAAEALAEAIVRAVQAAHTTGKYRSMHDK